MFCETINSSVCRHAVSSLTLKIKSEYFVTLLILVTFDDIVVTHLEFYNLLLDSIPITLRHVSISLSVIEIPL